MQKSIEQRLYDAYVDGKGLRLTAKEVQDLVNMDDAIQARICNRAADEAGGHELGGCLDTFGLCDWADLKHDALEACQ